MEVHRLLVNVHCCSDREVQCSVSSHDLNAPFQLNYYPDIDELCFPQEHQLSVVVQRHTSQVKKILRSAIKGNIVDGRSISAVLIDDFPFLPEQAYEDYIRLEYGSGSLKAYTVDEPFGNVVRLMADGSYNEDLTCSAYAGFVAYPGQEPMFYSQSFEGGSSNLMELLGVIDGLERLKSESVIQVNTDSRYVIRGMIQWMHFWRHNQWQTAYCSAVSNREQWQQLYALCEHKTLEIKWIKGHRGHSEHDLCHQRAQRAAKFK